MSEERVEGPDTGLNSGDARPKLDSQKKSATVDEWRRVLSENARSERLVNDLLAQNRELLEQNRRLTDLLARRVVSLLSEAEIIDELKSRGYVFQS